MSDYSTLKNAAIIETISTPTSNTDLGSDENRYGNIFLDGTVALGSTVVTATNILVPKIASIVYPGNDTAADTAGGQTITLTGTGFKAGASVLIGGSTASVVSVISDSSITFTSPASATGSYALYVINSDGGTGINLPGLQYSGTPVWSTSAGSLSSVYETKPISTTVTASGDAPVAYTIQSGTLPSGTTLNSGTGLLSGTAPADAGSTTYNFTIRASDAQNQDTDRSFSLTINTDAVTWSSPVDNTTYSRTAGELMSNIELSATSSASSTITYSANSLPTGVSISGSNIVGTPTEATTSSTILTATAAVTNRSATRTINWSVFVSVDEYFPSTVLLLKAEGANGADNNTFIDSSTNNYTVTKTGSPGQGTFSPFSQTGWSYYFNGSNNTTAGAKLNTPSNAAFTFGTGDFTVELWAFLPSSGFINGAALYSMVGQSFILRPENSSYWRVYTPAGNIDYPTSIVTDVWIHHAIVRTSGTTKYYQNGVLRGSIADPTNYTATSFAIADYSNYRCMGNISNFRIVKGTAVYTAAFTSPTTALTAISGTSLLTCQSNIIKDSSSNNFALAQTNTTGSVAVQAVSPFSPTMAYSVEAVGGSGYFNGSQRLTNTGTNLALGSGDFTIECWVYSTNITDGRGVFSIEPAAGVPGLILILASTHWQLTGYTNSSTVGFTSAAVPQPTPYETYPALTTWCHHAIVRSGGTVTWFINGVLVYTVSSSLNFTSTSLLVGSYPTTGSWIGYISNFRVVKGTAVYTAAFTPPTAPVTAIANTQLLLNFTNAGVIDSTAKNVMYTNSSVSISTDQAKYGSSSIYFAGRSYVGVVPSPMLKLGNKDWTFEFWLRLPNTTATGVWIVDWGTDPRLNLNGAALAWMTAGAARVTTASVLTANTWQHIAVVRFSGVTKIYVDGTQSGGSYADTNNYVATDFAGIGYDAGGSPFVGYIDDFRLSKGVARYTGTFTPPAALRTR